MKSKLSTVVITGTKGKTSVTHLLEHFLFSHSNKNLVVTVNSTGSYRNGERVTTYEDSIKNFGKSPNVMPGRYLYWNLKKNDNKEFNSIHCILEASIGSYKKGIGFNQDHDAVIFTNVYNSHLSKTIKNENDVYQRKLYVLDKLKPNGLLIFNLDNKYTRKLPSEKAVVEKKLKLIGISTNSENLEQNLKRDDLKDVIYLNKKTIFSRNEGKLLDLETDFELLKHVSKFDIENICLALAYSLEEKIVNTKSISKYTSTYKRNLNYGRNLTFSRQNHYVIVDYAHESNSLSILIEDVLERAKDKIDVFYRLSAPSGDSKNAIKKYVKLLSKHRKNISKFYLYGTDTSNLITYAQKYMPGELTKQFKQIVEKDLPYIKITLLKNEQEALEKMRSLEPQKRKFSVFIWNNLDRTVNFLKKNKFIFEQ